MGRRRLRELLNLYTLEHLHSAEKNNSSWIVQWTGHRGHRKWPTVRLSDDLINVGMVWYTSIYIARLSQMSECARYASTGKTAKFSGPVWRSQSPVLSCPACSGWGHRDSTIIKLRPRTRCTASLRACLGVSHVWKINNGWFRVCDSYAHSSVYRLREQCVSERYSAETVRPGVSRLAYAFLPLY